MWSSLRDLAKGEDSNVGDIFTSLVVFVGGVISGEGSDVGLDWLPVGNDVLGEGLGKLDWVGELFSPVLDLGNVTLDIFAVGEVSWDFLDDLTDFLSSLDDVCKVTLLEISDDSGEFDLKGLGVGHALLEFWKVIVLDEAIDKTGDHLFGTLDLHLVVSSKVSGNSCNESHFFVYLIYLLYN